MQWHSHDVAVDSQIWPSHVEVAPEVQQNYNAFSVGTSVCAFGSDMSMAPSVGVFVRSATSTKPSFSCLLLYNSINTKTDLFPVRGAPGSQSGIISIQWA